MGIFVGKINHKKYCVFVLILAAGALCACGPKAPALDCDLESYYSINISHEPEYTMHVVIHDLQGNEIYNQTYTKEIIVDYIGNCILSVTCYTGTMQKVVTYVDVHTGKTAVYDNPILAGNGVVCIVEPNPEKTRLMCKIHPMFAPDVPSQEVEFEAAMWAIPHSAITNVSFWDKHTIYLTYMLPDEEHEKTITIFLPRDVT